MIYIGIDPGKSGGMSVIYEDGEVTSIPYDRDNYISLLGSWPSGDCTCCLERVSAMPGNGSVSMFNFGCGFGWLQGLLDAYRISYELVRPQKWKAEFGVTKDKNTSIEVCKRLFPNVNLVLPGCKKPHDGMAESLLMAEYARRHF